MSSVSTKDKILEIAAVLFAEKGFDGVSIREIALAADVNVAAINYHFENKKNLYALVFVRNWDRLANGIRAIGDQDGLNLEELALQIFRFFIEEDAPIMNCFKILLNSNVEVPEGYHMDEELAHFGPPGGEVLMGYLEKEISEDLPSGAKLWAVGAIFTHIAHISIMMNTKYMKDRAKMVTFFDPDVKMEGIRHMTRSIVSYIRTNKDLDWSKICPAGC